MPHKAWKILKIAIDQWFTHRSARLGAALAYYSVFSMGPLLLIVISIAGLFFGADAVRGTHAYATEIGSRRAVDVNDELPHKAGV